MSVSNDLKFFKGKYGKGENRNLPDEPKAIIFNEEEGVVYVNGKSYSGTTDVSFNNGVLTIAYTDGRETTTLDFNDTASASATLKIFERVENLIGENVSLPNSDGKLNYKGTNYLEDTETLVEADRILDEVVFGTDGRIDKLESDFVDLDVRFKRLITDTELKLYCIEPITIYINRRTDLEDVKEFESNTLVDIFFNSEDTFEIETTSDKSILGLYAWPGALSEYYSWLEGVSIFDGVLFNMNNEDLYTKWSQGNQGLYRVQYAQYKNCIFWSDLPYISEVTKRTNYTLYYTSELPLCFSTIPDNTFKAFYFAYNVTCDPNWSNPVYKESFSKATWATQVFSYYGLHSIGLFDEDLTNFNITLPKDCRGLMFSSPNVLNAGVFDAINVTNFGANSGSWREAFGGCYQLTNLRIKNLKVNLNVSWSPINQQSLKFILSNSANTSAITIYLSPHTFYGLTDSNKALATEKNITLSLIDTNTSEDVRLHMLQMAGDGNSFLTNDGTYKSIDIPSLEGYAKTQEIETIEANIQNSLETIESDIIDTSNRVTVVENYTEIDASNKVLWLGTSIPAGDIQHGNNGTTQSTTTDLGSNNYPKMVADALGFTLYNNARGSSFVCFYPPEEDGTSNWAGASDWTEYQDETWKGFSLAASFAQVDEKFGPNGLNCPEWLVNQFKSYSYESLVIPYIDGTLASCDTVVIDHGYNDRAVIINQASWYPGDGETQFVAGAGRSWLKTLQDPFEQTNTTESLFQSAWWNDESVNSKKHYFNAMIFICKKIWAVNPRIKIIIGNYFAKKSNVFGAEYSNDRLGEFVCLANSAIANWLQVKCVNVADQTGLYNRNLPAGNDFQLFCPDGVHPHSDETGHSNSIIAGVYINAIRGTLYLK